MKSLTGTWRLIRLALRRDRLKLPAWIVVVSGLVLSSVPGIETSVASSTEEQTLYANTTASSAVARLFAGVVDGPSLGSIVMTELFVFMAVLFAFMCTLTVIRHTRYNEETGSAELISSGVVGRYASLNAALIVAVGASIITSLIVFAGLSQVDNLSLQGSLGISMAWGAVGIVFAGIAGIAAQVGATARIANSLAGGTIAIAYVLRGIGDGFGTVDETGMSVASTWVSWLSPIGWGQQIHPYTQQNWWVFGLFAITIVAVIAVSFLILRRRDVGLGLLAVRSGRAQAKNTLLSPLGSAWRLQRGVLIGWTVGLALYGGLLGAIGQEFEALVQENEVMQELFGSASGDKEFVDVLFGSMFVYVAAIAAAYTVQSLLKMRSEEIHARLEIVSATALSKIRWMLSHVGVTIAGSAFIMAVSGLTAGSVHALIAGGSWLEPIRVSGIALAQLPALLAFIGSIVLVYGLRSSWATIFAWGGFIGVLLITQLGALLELPQWVMNISPFGHLAAYPAEELAWTPIYILIGYTLTTITLGIIAFRKRDIVTN